jgi:hypothetical protein
LPNECIEELAKSKLVTKANMMIQRATLSNTARENIEIDKLEVAWQQRNKRKLWRSNFPKSAGVAN